MHHPYFNIFIFLLLIICLLFIPFNALGQSTEWSLPLNITNSETQSTWPSLAIDPAGTVHLVWQEEIEPGFNVIMYSKLDETGWSNPLDIISSSTDPAGVSAPALASDQNGYLHLAYLADGITYNKVYALDANSARNWLSPINLYPSVNYLSAPDLAVGSNGQIYIVFAIENGESSGIYLLSSQDNGINWEGPVHIYENNSANRKVSQPRIALDAKDHLHIAWTESNFPETFPPLGIRYTSSSDGINWPNPMSIADGPYTDLEIIAHGNSEVHVVWSGTDYDRYKFHRWSSDGGESWSDVYRVMEVGGLLGSPSLVFDGQGNLHWFTAGDYLGVVEGNKSTGYLFEYVFDGLTWSSGKILASTPLEVSAQNMSTVSAAVSLDNTLHVVFEDPRLKTNGDWQYDLFYLNRILNNTPATPHKLPTLIPTLKSTKPVPTQTVSPTQPSFPREEQSLDHTPWSNIAGALVPAVFLVVMILVINRKKK